MQHFSKISSSRHRLQGSEEREKKKTQLTHADRMEIDIDILPSTGRYRIRLVHDADVIVLLDSAVPPVPAEPVGVAKRKRMQVLDGFPVGDGDQRVASAILRAIEGRGFSQVCWVVSGGFRSRRKEEKERERNLQPHFSRLDSASFHMFSK